MGPEQSGPLLIGGTDVGRTIARRLRPPRRCAVCGMAVFWSRVVSVEHSPEAAEHGAFFTAERGPSAARRR
jgi:hypothetical protein